MKRSTYLKGFALISLFTAGVCFSQNTLYVNPDGNCGGSSPCYTTIHAAIAAAANGDTIKVDPATYSYTTQLSVNKEVVLMAREGQPVITSSFASYASCAVRIAANNVVIDGFEIIGVKATNGRYILGDYGSARNNWTVRNCRIHEGDNGIRMVGDNITIEGNEIFQTLGDCINGEYGKCGGLKVTGNWLHSENTNSGRKPAAITYNCDATTVGDVEISYNYVHSCRTFIDFQHNGGTGPANNILIMHNTVDWNMEALPDPVAASDIGQQMSIAFWTGSGTWDASKFTIRDNIFSRQKWYMVINTSGSSGPIAGNMEILNNLFYQWYLVDAYYPAYQYPKEWPADRGAVGWALTDDDFVFTDNLLSDPMYAATGATAGGYYSLLPWSPARNAATDGTNIGAWQSQVVWTGALNTDWNTPDNWSSFAVPIATDDAVIPDVPNKPVVDQPAATPAVCNALIIHPGSSVTINPDKALSVLGPLVNDAGPSGMVIKADNTGRGSLLHETAGVSGTMETYITPAVWHFISSPITTGLSGIFLDYYLQNHSEITNSYSDIIPTTIPLNVMQGYALYSAIPNTFIYSGDFNQGNQQFETMRLNEGWNLTGNPFPSSIDWDAPSGWSKNNVNDAVYIENNGGWATYIAGVGTNGGSRYIAPGQGFFVECNAHPGSLGMDNTVRVHYGAPFFKSSVSDMVRLQASGNGRTDETVIRFVESATPGFDGMFDAFKLTASGEVPEIFSVSGENEMSVNALRSAEPVEVGFRAKKSGLYTIDATEIQDIPVLYLEDKKTGAISDLTKEGYSFSYDPEMGSLRFTLHFSAPGIDEPVAEELQVYAVGKVITINLKSAPGAVVHIFNITGQRVYAAEIYRGKNEIPFSNSGVFLVRVTGASLSVSEKVFIE